jgi:predicted transcriptional regulator
MRDLKFQEPVTEEVEVDAEILAGIDRGLKAVKEGRVVSAEEARQRIQKWLTKSSTQKTR